VFALLAVERARDRDRFLKNLIDGVVGCAVMIVIDSSEKFQFHSESRLT